MNDIEAGSEAATESETSLTHQSELSKGIGFWTQESSSSKDRNRLRPRSYRSNGWTRENLSRYRKYDKLYGERKYARVFPDGRFRFLGLPAELRNHVYRYLLCFGSIELSAKADDDSGNRRAVKHHMAIYKRQIKPRLRMLRVNKQVNREAASIFYGENEFRFSSMHGHDLLLAFCRTIGKENTSFLRKIVEHVPWSGEYDEPVRFRDRPAHSNVTSWNNFRGILLTMGLHEEGRGARKFNIMRSLTRNNGGVVEYSLVLPDQFRLAQSHRFAVDNLYRSLLTRIKRKFGVRISVVRLYPSRDLGTWDVVRRVQEENRKVLAVEALANHWRLESAQLDELGNYRLDTKSRFQPIESSVVGL